MGDKGELIIQRGQQFIAHQPQAAHRRPGSGFPVADPGVTFEHFEAHAHFMQTVGQGFQFGGFVHHVLGDGDFAAVMQPGGDMQGFPFFLIGPVVTERASSLAAAAGEHQGDFRHALAVAAGVGLLASMAPAIS